MFTTASANELVCTHVHISYARACYNLTVQMRVAKTAQKKVLKQSLVTANIAVEVSFGA